MESVIERRLLVNYRVDPAWAARLVPAPFRPELVNGDAVAGVCLIRLGAVRPRGWPTWTGVRSENIAHRIAVEWEDGRETRAGMYIPQRHSGARMNVVAGGRAFPGVHRAGRFDV